MIGFTIDSEIQTQELFKRVPVFVHQPMSHHHLRHGPLEVGVRVYRFHSHHHALFEYKPITLCFFHYRRTSLSRGEKQPLRRPKPIYHRLYRLPSSSGGGSGGEFINPSSAAVRGEGVGYAGVGGVYGFEDVAAVGGGGGGGGGGGSEREGFGGGAGGPWPGSGGGGGFWSLEEKWELHFLPHFFFFFFGFEI
ncbi:hypothetical protein LOK49_LG12G01914 [Camellia lanceoleosa]|uniref:Uncharacterized protein n=1 Tax=Camellia lanceoleosa TaxID=1840588 RepID=A0ACC0FTT4_9ERIC|nr:hypothetical protein LOK49_LG12G01914 [Camellia lanceoleosa]